MFLLAKYIGAFILIRLILWMWFSLSVVNESFGFDPSRRSDESHLGLRTQLLLAYLLTYLDTSFKRSGDPWPWFQRSKRLWGWVRSYFHDASIECEEPLNHEQQYIFCYFPHGAVRYSIQERLIMKHSFFSHVSPLAPYIASFAAA
jgi:hypothetical protein